MNAPFNLSNKEDIMATETKAKETKEVKEATFNTNEWMKERATWHWMMV